MAGEEGREGGRDEGMKEENEGGKVRLIQDTYSV